MNRVNPIRVLLVDDSTSFRQRMAAYISDLPGVEVVGEALDVRTGRALFESLHPDVVVLDIGLPGPSGIELLEVLKEKSAPPVVIMLTNYNLQPLRERCFELGADYYFYKAEEFERALDVCEHLAERRRHAQNAPDVLNAASEPPPSSHSTPQEKANDDDRLGKN